MNDNTLEDIRDKTEETDLNSILRPTVIGGGYTKRSVIEYLSYVKKQQQDTKEAYLEEIDSLKSEKERLTKENSELGESLGEAMQKLSDGESKLKKSEAELAEVSTKAAASAKNEAELRALYDDASAKNEELNQIIADMSAEPEKQVIMSSCDIEILSEEDINSVSEKVYALTESVEQFKKELEEKANALGEQTLIIGELAREQLEKSRETMEKLQIEIQAKIDQYELLESEKNSLTMRVEELLEANLTLGKENTRLKAANAILQRRMEVR